MAYALGYTGLGVGATRFGAEVMLDLLDGEPTPRTGLRMVRPQPLPVPAGAAGLRGHPADPVVAGAGRPPAGRRNLLLRTLDRIGLGFDS